VLVLVFIGLPFVVRTVQPCSRTSIRRAEEAAASLGAGRWQAFRRVILPRCIPRCSPGSRSPSRARWASTVRRVRLRQHAYKTEIAPVLIVARLEEFAYGEATAIAVVLLAISFAMLVLINLLERWSKRGGRECLSNPCGGCARRSETRPGCAGASSWPRRRWSAC
jgi:sulfate transport system permease protein